VRRVAVTGVGLVSNLGSDLAEIVTNLRQGRSAVVAVPEWAELGLSSTIAAKIPDADRLRTESGFTEEQLLCMSDVALFCSLAARDAIRDAGLDAHDLGSRNTGCIVGSGTSGAMATYEGARQLFAGRARRISPFIALQTMASSCSANLVNVFGIGGRSYSISSGCATSAHAIGHAFELIREGRQDLVIAGGGEELNEVVAGAFNAMRMALSTHFNDTPALASRPFDNQRDGFVLGEGAGIVVLEDWQRAEARGARVRGEIIGFAANSDGNHMVLPRSDGGPATECMVAALDDAGLAPGDVDYVNAHATSTRQGDTAESQALLRVFSASQPLVSSTKSMTGHSLAAAGAHELIFCLAMMEHGFVAPSVNVESIDGECGDLNLVTEAREKDLDVVLSNSFGFGGTNATLILRRA
jgi:3-oxoacyl-[acyl-carrier-protein] synthase-1